VVFVRFVMVSANPLESMLKFRVELDGVLEFVLQRVRQFLCGVPMNNFSLSTWTILGSSLADRWISTVSGESILVIK